jgi:hypothetical protein
MIDIERLAREAGFVAYGEDCGEYRIPTPAFKHRMEWFAALVRNEVLEEAADTADELRAPQACSMVEKSLWDVATTSAGDAIRSLKDKK